MSFLKFDIDGVGRNIHENIRLHMFCMSCQDKTLFPNHIMSDTPSSHFELFMTTCPDIRL